jgi:hypothetical protein
MPPAPKENIESRFVHFAGGYSGAMLVIGRKGEPHE